VACQKLKPAWDKLREEYKDSKTQLVAAVDCASPGGKPLCEANKIRGYPTLKWGDPDNLEDYSGLRDFESLKAFVDEKLKPICSPTHMDLCDKATTKEIKKLHKLKMDALQEKIKNEEGKIEKLEADHKKYAEDMKAKYHDAVKDKEAKIAAVKDSGLTLMKRVEVWKKKHA
jgi:hypothetical protein